MKEIEIKELDQRQHILQRPNMYIGAINKVKVLDYIVEDSKIVKKELEFVGGLVKIINEVIDNSVDIAIKTNFNCNSIIVKITDDFVEVQDNGCGIPCTKNASGNYLPYVCWGKALSGSNFNDGEDHVQMGMNGLGVYCTNVYSSKFTGISDDGKNRYEVTFKNNASEYVEVLKKSKEHGVIVKFYPDLARFGMDKIDDTTKNIIKQRLINLSISFPKITFTFNNEKIAITSFKKYVQMFSNDFEAYETENYSFAFLSSDSDEFQHFSYVNGLKISDGGTHIDYISNNVSNIIRDKLLKKYKTIKPADVRNKLMLICFIKNFPSPKFNSQTKEKITNTNAEVSLFLGNIDYESIAKRILKNEKLIDPIIEVFKIKEEFKRRQELKSLEKPTKKIKDDNYLSATKEKKYLLICEGQSALGGLAPCCGREYCGYYTLMGKPLNVWSSTQQKFTSNKELSNLYQVIKNENYERIIFSTDADLDGYHIRALLSGFVKRYLTEYLDRVGFLETPLVASFKNGKIQRWSYSLDGLKLNKGETSFYFKGLGSWEKDDLQLVIKTDTLEKMFRPIDFTDSDESLNEWLGNDSEPRKKYILENDFNIASV